MTPRTAILLAAVARTRGPYACNCTEDVPAPRGLVAAHDSSNADRDGGSGAVDAMEHDDGNDSGEAADAAVLSQDAAILSHDDSGAGADADPDAPPDPCVGIACPPRAPSCLDAATLRTYDPGRCDGGVCAYAATDTVCPFGCADGACRPDPCLGVTCDAPPAPTCADGLTLRTAGAGTCSSGACVYPTADAACPGSADPCLAPACLADRCVLVAAPDGTSCDDSDVCTEGDACASGACTPARRAVAWWTFDEASGTALDRCGGHDAVPSGTVGRVAGVSGTAASFDGSGYLRVADAPDLDLPAWTIEAWVRTTATDIRWLVSRGPGAIGYQDRLSLYLADGGRVAARVGNCDASEAFAEGPDPASDGAWHHLSATSSDGEIALSIDEVEVARTPYPFSPCSGASDIAVGAWGSAFRFVGAIDDLRIYAP